MGLPKFRGTVDKNLDGSKNENTISVKMTFIELFGLDSDQLLQEVLFVF
jgi:hypothetical protein